MSTVSAVCGERQPHPHPYPPLEGEGGFNRSMQHHVVSMMEARNGEKSETSAIDEGAEAGALA